MVANRSLTVSSSGISRYELSNSRLLVYTNALQNLSYTSLHAIGMFTASSLPRMHSHLSLSLSTCSRM